MQYQKLVYDKNGFILLPVGYYPDWNEIYDLKGREPMSKETRNIQYTTGNWYIDIFRGEDEETLIQKGRNFCKFVSEFTIPNIEFKEPLHPWRWVKMWYDTDHMFDDAYVLKILSFYENPVRIINAHGGTAYPFSNPDQDGLTYPGLEIENYELHPNLKTYAQHEADYRYIVDKEIKLCDRIRYEATHDGVNKDVFPGALDRDKFDNEFGPDALREEFSKFRADQQGRLCVYATAEIRRHAPAGRWTPEVAANPKADSSVSVATSIATDTTGIIRDPGTHNLASIIEPWWVPNIPEVKMVDGYGNAESIKHTTVFGTRMFTPEELRDYHLNPAAIPYLKQDIINQLHKQGLTWQKANQEQLHLAIYEAVKQYEETKPEYLPPPGTADSAKLSKTTRFIVNILQKIGVVRTRDDGLLAVELPVKLITPDKPLEVMVTNPSMDVRVISQPDAIYGPVAPWDIVGDAIRHSGRR